MIAALGPAKTRVIAFVFPLQVTEWLWLFTVHGAALISLAQRFQDYLLEGRELDSVASFTLSFEFLPCLSGYYFIKVVATFFENFLHFLKAVR